MFFGKTLVLSIICGKCKNGVKNIGRKILMKQEII